MANFEIRENIKFLTRLNWKPVRSLKLYNRFMVSAHHVEQLLMIGLNASRREGSNLNMIQERGDPIPGVFNLWATVVFLVGHGA